MPDLLRIQTEDNTFQHLLVLKSNRQKRHQYKKIFVEGVTPINLAIKFGWKVESFIFAEQGARSSWAEQLLTSVPAEQHIILRAPLLEKLSDKEETSEILAVLKYEPVSLSSVLPRAGGLIALFDRPSSPGNLGSSIRSAEAFNVDGIFISGHAADPFDPRVIRSSIGTVFCRPIIKIDSPDQVKEWLTQAKQKALPYRVVGTSARATEFIHECDLCVSTLICFGNETDGLSRSYQELAETTVKIPISGAVSSLNVSCAASIVFYEIARQRRST